MTNKSIFILAGEPSGDLHGAALASSLKQQLPDLSLSGWGGPLMESSGVDILRTLDKLAFMGFVEVIKNAGKILENFREIKKQLTTNRPDALLLVDYPGFNLRLARWAASKDIPVYFFVSPTVWAWKPKRMYKVRDYIKKMYCILPFEPPFYEKHGIVNALYLGNPLIDKVHNFVADPKIQNQLSQNAPYIAVLPGSRQQELDYVFPEMVLTMRGMSEMQFVVACSDQLPPAAYEVILKQLHPEYSNHITLIRALTYDVLQGSTSAMVTSGTATLETALFGIPQVVCYKTSKLNFAIASAVVKLKFISLVNLIYGGELVTELIQKKCTAQHIISELKQLNLPGRRTEVLNGYKQIKSQLGEPDVAGRVATHLISSLGWK
ncbi:MAG TPA: lipid-A-disaccharide synthase [Saprospiraceae bacterium]|nr:lipid-A-disaccharide synthase [Saprospiraceae bacterium]HQW56239.1 lipid-A-disaccharide synthase [Saprospiraceae bacterium]